MGDLISRLVIWTVVCGGPFVWDYHQQRRPDLPPSVRTVRRWRMVGCAAVGLALIWLTLAHAGLARRVDIEAERPPFPTVWWLPQPRLVAATPLEAILLPVALIGGAFVIIACTVLLLVQLVPTGSGRARERRTGSRSGGPEQK